ncbi:MAG: hypothetical protein ABT01_04190 [Clostridium sp. SCN 57-10]|nr:MAG: hypothetical protein ABT01_04190 [Clostridium sp. SCN 57-10]
MRKRLLILFATLFTLCSIVGIVLLVDNNIKYRRAAAYYEQLAKLATQTTPAPSTTTAPEQEPDPLPAPESYESPIDFEALFKINPDIVGWISMPDLDIDFPIVQGATNDTYLRTAVDGSYSKAGSIFLDYESDPSLGGRHCIIYGHNLKTGVMFEPLTRLKSEEEFNAHRDLTLYTPDRTIKLRIFAAYAGPSEAIQRKTKFSSDESFADYITEMTAPCTFADPPDFAISTLYSFITCSYEKNDYRTYIYAYEVPQEP